MALEQWIQFFVPQKYNFRKGVDKCEKACYPSKAPFGRRVCWTLKIEQCEQDGTLDLERFKEADSKVI
jgi:hypothetical protein